LQLLLEVRSKATGALVYTKEEPVCTFLNTEKSIVPDVINASNIPPAVMTGACPFPAGKYWIKNAVFDEKKFNNVAFGNYIARVTLSERGKTLAAIEVKASFTL
jgi:hypothetical protein